ncbi:MAG: peptidase M56 BlaR1 [Firmicutes bacterium HGW-Firmicutes-13]|nr:MAG: peptidase M56 BlaR1 [Firmicutes bacterium HGW-Firmicutes-13]
MKIKSRSVKMLLFVVALLTGIIIGTNSFAAVNHRNPNSGSVPEYAVNKYGETYGSDFYAPTPDTAPELILARGVDGTIGYVRNTDLNGEVPKTPEQAIEQQKKSKTRMIPLYDVDGKTVIGQFRIDSANNNTIRSSH